MTSFVSGLVKLGLRRSSQFGYNPPSFCLRDKRWEYQSTRGQVSGLSFKQAVMMGLASDGGLLVPQHIPDVTHHLGDWRDCDYPYAGV